MQAHRDPCLDNTRPVQTASDAAQLARIINNRREIVAVLTLAGHALQTGEHKAEAAEAVAAMLSLVRTGQ